MFWLTYAIITPLLEMNSRGRADQRLTGQVAWNSQYRLRKWKMRINFQKFSSDFHIYTPNPKQIKNNDILSSLKPGLVAHTYNRKLKQEDCKLQVQCCLKTTVSNYKGRDHNGTRKRGQWNGVTGLGTPWKNEDREVGLRGPRKVIKVVEHSLVSTKG